MQREYFTSLVSKTDKIWIDYNTQIFDFLHDRNILFTNCKRSLNCPFLFEVFQMLPTMSVKSLGTLAMIYATDELQNPLLLKTMLCEGDMNNRT